MPRRFWFVACQVLSMVLCITDSIFSSDNHCIPLRGEIVPKMRQDTLVIRYHLTLPDSCGCDSMGVQIGVDSGAGIQQSGVISGWLPLTPTPVDKSRRADGCEWRGQLRLPGNSGGIPQRYRLRLDGPGIDSLSSDTSCTRADFVFYPAGTAGRRANFGLAFSTGRGFDGPVRSSDRNLVYRVEDRWGYYQRRFSLFLGYGINYSKRFSLHDYLRFEAEAVPWGRDKWLPVLHLAASYSSVKGYEEPNKFVKKGLGIEVGARIDGPYESLRYGYNTTAGGYHRVDMILACVSGFGGKKVGSMYSVYSGQYVRMIAVSVYMEGWGMSNNDTLEYRNRRPLLHKALAWLALVPFLPLAWAAAG